MKQTYLLFFSLFIIGQGFSQTRSPAEFLGYEMGQRFTPHHKVIAYYEHIAATNDNVVLEYYGQTSEFRPLLVAFVSAKDNIDKLETLRADNLKRAGLIAGNPETQLPITWLSYNVHGNEAVSSEAAMMTLYALVDPNEPKTKAWLENSLVIMDPCLNPDGQERYVNWYNQKGNAILQPDPQSVEHREPWPGGRPNHYLFDLNRDWAWQTQKESQERVALYNRWLPQVHVDFHEMGIDEPYFFAPAAEPLHEQLSSFQKEYQELFGRNTAKYFDQEDWFYYTKERFDLLYPSYGDTYPMYNGAIGMTIEQGGSGRAGLGMLNAEGDTVTLTDRILHHHTTALSAIEVTSQHGQRVVEEFANYFAESSSNPKAKYKSFVIKGTNAPDKVAKLLELLDKNGIRYGRGGSNTGLTGFNYLTGTTGRFSVSENDIVINAYQPKSVLTQVLFEPEPVLNDSLTYDITTWALPYAYNLEAFAVETRVNAAGNFEKAAFEMNTADPNVLAYIAPWNATKHVAFLTALMQEKIRVRSAALPFNFGDQSYPGGSLVITRAGNKYVADFHQKVTDLANKFEISLGKTTTGYVDEGKDLGSDFVRAVKTPKIALIGGAGTSSLNFGEIWHFLEQELSYPVSILEKDNLASFDLGKYDVIIMPSGSYGKSTDAGNTNLIDWVKKGGKLIAVENAVEIFVETEGFSLAKYGNPDEKDSLQQAEADAMEQQLILPYLERERNDISGSVVGAVMEATIDQTHPLGYGIGDRFYTLKNNSNRYGYLAKGVNVGHIPSLDRHRAGFIGYKIKPQFEKSLVFGVENIGRGQVVYLVDNPMFRSFWESGKLVMANAVFLVGN
ncbi:MAG TPA: M14 metallopeptidase family protein [Lunatimonas sp.]|nr:M14 metallopeptidase family protein [Lunatimonas sp.]